MHYAWLCFHGRSHIRRIIIIIINVHTSKSYSTNHKQLNIYSCVLTKSTRVRVKYLRVRIHCPQAEVLHLLVRMSELQVSCACEHCKWKYHTCTYGPRMCTHAYSHFCARTHTVLALVRYVLTSATLTSCKYSLYPYELNVSER